MKTLKWVPAVAVLLLTAGLVSAEDSPSEVPATGSAEQQVVVKILAREFNPSLVTLHAGQKTVLVFQNLDAELHAFVSEPLFRGVNLNVTGNGAPEFGPHGLKRIIIPSQGQAEIRFVPEHAGSYPFFCDMPGHEMKATIVVQ
jgi:plastocyanin